MPIPDIRPASVVKAAGDLIWCEIDGEAAILSMPAGVYYGLDNVGASVWRLLNEPRSVAALVDAITSEYEVDAAQCERDLIALLHELAQHGLVEINEAAAA
jgi:hypothetical protein